MKIEAIKKYYERYRESEDISLISVYKHPSRRKIEVYESIVKGFNDDPYHKRFRIITHNIHFFTVGYMTTDEQNGKDIFVVITPFDHGASYIETL